MNQDPTLIVDLARPNAIAYCARNPTAIINGGLVFYAEVLQAIVRYTSAKRICFLNIDGDPPICRDDLDPCIVESPLVTFVTPHALEALNRSRSAIFLTPTEQAGALSGVRLASGMQHAPLISFLHAADTNWFLPHYSSYLARGAQTFDALVCSSTAGRSVVERLHSLMALSCESFARPATPLIPLGICPDLFIQIDKAAARTALCVSENACLVLYFGRLEMRGKADLCPLLLLLNRLPKSESQRLAVICAGGDRPRETASKLSAFAAEHARDTDIRVISNPSDAMKRRLLAAADLFISPADGIRETFGLSLLEAMAAGLPVVVTDWSGYRDIVEDGGNGFLIPTAWQHLTNAPERMAALGWAHDEVLASATFYDTEAMYKALSLLIKDRELRSRFGRRSREIVLSKYSWEVVVRGYDRLFEEQLNAASKSTPRTAYPFVQDLFKGYPSSIVPPDIRYRRGLLSQGSFAEDLRRTTHHPEWIDDIFLHGIEQMLDQNDTLSLNDVVAALRHENTAALHLGRLCKYGLLEVDGGLGE